VKKHVYGGEFVWMFPRSAGLGKVGFTANFHPPLILPILGEDRSSATVEKRDPG
jgi:hypothetical protein